MGCICLSPTGSQPGSDTDNAAQGCGVWAISASLLLEVGLAVKMQRKDVDYRLSVSLLLEVEENVSGIKGCYQKCEMF